MGMASPQPLSEGQKRFYNFIADSAKQTGLGEDEIRSLLKTKFGAYSPKDEGKYLNYLRQVVFDMEEQERREKEQIEREMGEANAGIHFPEHCPYHPDVKLKGNTRWGRKGFICNEGGERCFHRWRVTEMASRKGVSVDFASFDAKVKEHGGIEAYVTWRLDHENQEANAVAGS